MWSMVLSCWAVLKLFKLDPTKKGLSHPSGPLSTIILASSSIAAANEGVKTIVIAGEKENIVLYP